MNPGRNDPCSCGSGKKYKNCCLGKVDSQLTFPPSIECDRLIALSNAGHHAELENRAHELVKRYPTSGFVWKLLGESQYLQGKTALLALQKAAEFLPGDADAHNNLGLVLTDLGRFDEALASFRRALKIKPDDARTNNNLGIVLLDLGQLNDAAECFSHALKIKPDYAKAYFNLGNVLRDLGQFEDAAVNYRRAIQLKPDYAIAHVNLGTVLRELGKQADALKSYRNALEIDPGCADAISGRGQICLDNGELVEAETLFRRALMIKPDNLEVRFSLASVKKTKVGDENLAALKAMEVYAQNSTSFMSNKNAILLHFALGKCYDDIGEYDRAFPHFAEGCKLKRATLRYDAGQLTQHFSDIIRIFDRKTIDRLRGGGNPSRLPIFVLGMPRSGTTLTEQIIASHPDVHGAGELPILPRISQYNSTEPGTPFPNNILALDQQGLAIMAESYLSELHRLSPDALHITDKVPTNFCAIGLIHLMLPNAKIIHVNRNPVDTCFSCYTQLFSGQSQSQTYDLAELGRYYVDYSRLMEHWRSVLPADAFLDVKYEDIVADQETLARHIIGFCGLEWDDACIDFHKNKRSVHTASVSQVRQPIYQSSVARWRHYEKFLGPLLEALGGLHHENEPDDGFVHNE